jgi:hypothetical protein
MFFQPFVEEFVGNLNGQGILNEPYGLDRLKPGFETLGVDILADSLHTAIPYGSMVPNHSPLR